MESRFGRAITLSLGTHVAGALVLAFFLTGRGTRSVSSPSPVPLDSRLVWLPGADLPAGGMGGGDEQTAPPQSARVEGPGEVAVPSPGPTPPPRYPATAMRRGSTGTVLVRVEVGVDGTPTDVQVAKRRGSRDLDRAAREAVRDWRFRPGQRNGQPVTSVVTIPIDFSLER